MLNQLLSWTFLMEIEIQEKTIRNLLLERINIRSGQVSQFELHKLPSGGS